MSCRRPPVLYTLCAVELLERLAGNLLAALLLFFLTERLQLPVGDATRLIGGFHALSYALAILGGWLADRYLGSGRTVGAGLGLLTVGYLTLMVQERSMALAGLALLVVGHGLFKPNITALFGEVYPAGDTRRERAYRLFYLVINVGTVLGPILGALVAARAGWSAAFTVAGAALAVASLLFWLTSGSRTLTPVVAAANSSGAMAAVPVVHRPAYGHLLRLLIGVVLFEGAMNQSASTLLLFARDYTRREVGRLALPPALFASLPALFALIITPLAALRPRETSSSLSVAARLRSLARSPLCGLGAYGLLAFATTAHPGRVSALWLASSLFILTLGELYLYGRGLALLGELVPGVRGSLVYGLWFVASALGQWLSGQLGVFYARGQPCDFFLLFVGLEAVAVMVLVPLRQGK